MRDSNAAVPRKSGLRLSSGREPVSERAPSSTTRARRNLLSAEEEIQLAWILRDTAREMLSLALSSSTALDALARMVSQVNKQPAQAWDFVERRSHGDLSDTLESAAERLASWYELWLRARADEAFAQRARLAQETPLTTQAQVELLNAAEPGLRADRHARFREARRRADEARQAFVSHNQGLVVQCAMRFSGFGLPLPDLIQEGNVGLLRAIEKFDPDLGYRFSTYAIWWVRQAIRRAVDCQGTVVRLPVHLQEARRRLRRAERRCAKGDSSAVSDADLAAEAKLSIAQVQELRHLSADATSLDDCEPGDRPLAARLSNEDAIDALGATLREEGITLIRGLMSRLTPREQVMLSMRFGLDGLGERSLQQVGHHFGVTRERARQIMLGAFAKLRPEYMNAIG